MSKRAGAGNYSIVVESGAGGGSGNQQNKKKAIALAPEAQQRINYNELLFMMTDTQNPTYTQQQIALQ